MHNEKLEEIARRQRFVEVCKVFTENGNRLTELTELIGDDEVLKEMLRNRIEKNISQAEVLEEKVFETFRKKDYGECIVHMEKTNEIIRPVIETIEGMLRDLRKLK